MGLQHALAMTGGIVLGPIIVASTNPNVNITQCKQSPASQITVASSLQALPVCPNKGDAFPCLQLDY